jgi:hypothetical protein
MAKINLNSILAEPKNAVERIVETIEVAQIPLPNFDAILLEWSYQCEKGYPDFKNKADMFILQNILESQGIEVPVELITEAPVPTVQFKKFTGLLDANQKDLWEPFIKTMPNNLFLEFQKFINGLSNTEALMYAKVFKSLDSVAKLNNVSYKPYQKLWDTFVGQAIGKGELFISFFVLNGVVQGSSQSFDIADGDAQYEVKSLDILDSKSGKYKAGNIRPGAEGKVSRFEFTKQLMNFYTIVNELQEPNTRASVMTLASKSAMDKIMSIVDKVQVKKSTGDLVTITPGDVPMGMLDNTYNAIEELHKKLTSLTLNKDVTTSRIIVKGTKIDSQYWISSDDADDIAKNAGKPDEIKIRVGQPVTDETKEGKIILADLMNHPFIKDPKNFTSGLQKIKKAFFGEKAGLIYFQSGITKVSSDMSEFATIESSQDGYRFGLKNKYLNRPYIQKQP